MKKRASLFIICGLLAGTLASCGKKPERASDASSAPSPSESSPKEKKYAYREERDFTTFPLPSDVQDESTLPLLPNDAKLIDLAEGGIGIEHGDYRLEFATEGTLSLAHFEGENSETDFKNDTPVRLFLKGSEKSFALPYSRLEKTSYGVKATAEITSSAGTVIHISDCYYVAKEDEANSFNVSSLTEIVSANEKDTGFASEYSFASANANAMEWWAPEIVYKTLSGTDVKYKEVAMGAPMTMMRDSKTGATLSLARYQPAVTYRNNDYATFELNSTAKSMTVAYPSNEANRKYHDLASGAKHVYELSLRAERTPSFLEAMPSFYNAEFNLQHQRIVNTDIDEVYKVINEDYKTFLHEEEQEDKDTGKKYKSYGLPWRITIEDGEFGPFTYQAGFIGQQIPSAYNMMLYGLMNNDATSLQNGIHLIDFWVNDAEFMSVAGVPHIWYDTWADGFRAYPCFLRMAVDAMEGLLDAYRLALANGIPEESWGDAVNAFGQFLLNYQNEDGSYYRCYNYEGGPFQNWDDEIEEPAGNICQSESKSCTPIAIRFLGKMYEFTGDESYKEAALKAGNYVYQEIYPTATYWGGTCDNPNRVDKEAGVFAMYAYDTLYTLTGEAKWLQCLKQAATFTMSTVMIFSFETKPSILKSAYPLQYGYNDGMSFIVCESGAGVDNYAAYIYYELFRIYILTGDKSYLKQAEFIQQNTKSIMNWDGALGYKYKSLVAEASSISTFTYSSASDGAWVSWSSVANAEPIAKMYTNFGTADVMDYQDVPVSELAKTLSEIGVGGKAHRAYENTIVSTIEA